MSNQFIQRLTKTYEAKEAGKLIYLLEDVNGNTYGYNIDPATGDCYKCVKIKCMQCENPNNMYSELLYITVDDIINNSKYNDISPICVECGKDVTKDNKS